MIILLYGEFDVGVSTVSPISTYRGGLEKFREAMLFEKLVYTRNMILYEVKIHQTREHLILMLKRVGGEAVTAYKTIFEQSIRCKSNSSKRWLERHSGDHHTKQAKAEHYRSRAAFKLIELDNKFRLFNKRSINIVDLGFAPGAWTQVAIEKMKKIGTKSKILGVDLINCSAPQGSSFIQGDILSKKTHDMVRDFFNYNEHEPINDNTNEPINESSKEPTNEPTKEQLHEHLEGELPVDLIISDMMANTSGIKDNDHFASMDLCDGAIIMACLLLKPGGSLVMKFYTGKEDSLLLKKMQTMFEKVYRMKPDACRNELREMYIIGTKKRAEIHTRDIFT